MEFVVAKPDETFVATLLEASAGGYAGAAASRLLEKHPAIEKRYEPGAFDSWKDQFQRWILDLSAAVEAGEPKLFEARMSWTRRAFAAREAPIHDLAEAIEAMREVIVEGLPPGTQPVVVDAFELAQAAVRKVTNGDETFRNRAGRSALKYLETILAGRPREAIESLIEAVDGGRSVAEIYSEILIPAQREVGTMWHEGSLGIAEEHVVTSTTQRAMDILGWRRATAACSEKNALLACVRGNIHDVGVRAIADLFEIEGWNVVNLGPNVPEEEISRAVQMFDAQVVVLAAALDPHVRPVKRAIERIRALNDREVQVIVGGPVFDEVPGLWKKVGADGHSATIGGTEALAKKLAGT